MSKFDSEKVMPRYFAIAVVLTLLGVAIIGKAFYIMTAKKDYWTEVADRLVRDSVTVKPNRGNILSCDGQLMASSIPEYRLYFDFLAGGEKKDSILLLKMDSICIGLNKIFPTKSVEEFRRHMEEGREKKARNWAIWPKRVDYSTYTEVKKLPVFNMGRFKGGFKCEECTSRRKPFGSLAKRTVGDMFGAKDTARCGLELSYDSILRGTNGLTQRRKVLKKYLSIPVLPPIDGCDIVTTIDVGIQDLAERALIEELKDPQVHGDAGVVIVMDVPTGDIKAMVNMTKCADGEYREIKNYAVSNLLEPGSVFKTASIMVALDDGVVDTTYKVDTGCGIWKMYGRDMKDHNWRRGGYQVISLPRALEVSSNIGVSRIIDDHYHAHPEKFVEGIRRIGLASDLNIPIAGSTPPRIRMPKKNDRGQYLNWSKTALLWMSIGYETQIPPIYTLTFYNAIANNGRMMQPRFVKATVKNGDTLTAYPPQVVKGREQIASEKTIKIMQDLLHRVVINGTGKKANSPNFWVCGKTGTAMIAKNGSYKGAPNHLLSFAGWFGEKDKPYYSCIVCIQKQGLPAYGWMSGQVFKDIAEGIMAKYVRYDISDARDSTSHPIPDVKNGNIFSAQRVLSLLGINTTTNYATPATQAALVWGEAQRNAGSVLLKKEGMASRKHIPNVMGMGARDAVYLIESRGVRCIVRGRGKVVEQSLEPGHYIKKGEICTLKLE